MSSIYLAPMVGWTTTLFRQMIQVFNPDVHVFTEMLTIQSLVYGKKFDKCTLGPEDRHVICQLAGGDKNDFLSCALYKETFQGFDEINLNVGCPSAKVKNAQMGACLMYDPKRVAECVVALGCLERPVSIKCRIGVDQQTSDDLYRFIDTIAPLTKKFYIHARYALLDGINPKQNRSVPPIQYGVVRDLAHRYPDISVVINGEINTVEKANMFLADSSFDGVMIGRAAYQNPWLFYQLSDRKGFPQRIRLFLNFLKNTEHRDLDWFRTITTLTRGLPGGKKCRQLLSENNQPDLERVCDHLEEALIRRCLLIETDMETAHQE